MTKAKTLTVVVKEPDKEPEVREIDYHDYHDLAKLIAIGEYEMLELVGDGPPGLDLWANEEGKYASYTENGETRHAAANLQIFEGPQYYRLDYVMGTVFVAASTSDGETRGLEPMEVDIATEWLKQHAVGKTGRLRAEALAEAHR
jgi:hypothetical protein